VKKAINDEKGIQKQIWLPLLMMKLDKRSFYENSSVFSKPYLEYSLSSKM